MESKYFCAKSNGKLNYWHTILTGFGFMASSIAWAIYDPYITKILNRLLNESAAITSWSAKLNEAFPALASFAEANGEDVGTAAGGITLVPLFIGIIMTFDNIFGVIFQPTFGKLSDNTHSRLGKRRPFVVYGAPISALLFAIIPIIAVKFNSLGFTMLFIILFVFVMSLWRAPVVALMPDLTPNELRSEGNAVINLMGGIGSALGLFAGTIVTAIYCAAMGISSKSPEFDEYDTFPYVFLLGAAIMIIGMLVILFFVKEPDSRLKLKADMAEAADQKAKGKAEAPQDCAGNAGTGGKPGGLSGTAAAAKRAAGRAVAAGIVGGRASFAGRGAGAAYGTGAGHRHGSSRRPARRKAHLYPYRVAHVRRAAARSGAECPGGLCLGKPGAAAHRLHPARGVPGV